MGSKTDSSSCLVKFLLSPLIVQPLYLFHQAFNMAPSATNKNLEAEDHARDAAFNKALHGNSSQAKGGISAMLSKGGDAKKAAVDEYFKHWDNKPAENETAEERAVC